MYEYPLICNCIITQCFFLKISEIRNNLSARYLVIYTKIIREVIHVLY